MLGRIDGVMRLAQCSSDRGVIHNVENMNGLSVVSEIANQYGNGDVVTAPAEGNGNGINGNPIRCYNCRGEGHYASNCTVKSRKHNAAYLQQSYRLLVAQEDEARDLKGTQGNLRSWTTADAHEEQERMDQLRSIWFAAQLEISKLQLRVKSSDTQCASNTIDLVSQKLEDENVSEQKGTTKGTRTNTMFTKQSILGKPPSSSYKPKLHSVTPFPKSSVLPKVDKTNALSKPVTSNSAPATRESKVVQTVNVIAPRIFRTNPSKTSRVDNVVPNKPVKTSVQIKPITVSQPNVIHKQQANYDSNGFSSTRVNNTAKTRRPHHRSNFNTDRVPSKSKSSCLSNNIEKIEENLKNSQIPKNQKHMSSKCNNIYAAFEKC
ncbi:reverse transcriptase domain-containing protein [Tanacetum coccineum]|uniref:Reverse transcriptase domain-containing protein n=1 Tax=Tanacetum coccineum TaxID=301880 RepID=A0ABQ4Y582_9ASTR